MGALLREIQPLPTTPSLQDAALSTGSRKLIGGNTCRGDTFWGVCNAKVTTCSACCLMQVRDRVRAARR